MRNFLSALFFSVFVHFSVSCQAIYKEDFFGSTTGISLTSTLTTNKNQISISGTGNFTFKGNGTLLYSMGFICFKSIPSFTSQTVSGTTRNFVAYTNTPIAICAEAGSSSSPGTLPMLANRTIDFNSTEANLGIISSSSNFWTTSSKGKNGQLLACGTYYVYVYKRGYSTNGSDYNFKSKIYLSNEYIQITIPPHDLLDANGNSLISNISLCSASPGANISTFLNDPAYFNEPLPSTYDFVQSTINTKVQYRYITTQTQNYSNWLDLTQNDVFLGESTYEFRLARETPLSGGLEVTNFSNNTLFIQINFIQPSPYLILEGPSQVVLPGNNLTNSLLKSLDPNNNVIMNFLEVQRSIYPDFYNNNTAQFDYEIRYDYTPLILDQNTNVFTFDFSNETFATGDNFYYRMISSDYCGNVVTSQILNVFRIGTPFEENDPTNPSLLYNNQSVCLNANVSSLQKPTNIFAGNNELFWEFFQNSTTLTPFTGLVSELVWQPAPNGDKKSIWVRYKFTDANSIEHYSETPFNISLVMTVPGVWTGNAGPVQQNGVDSYDFSDPENWSCGIVPQTPTIPENTIVYIDGSYDFTNVIIECGGQLVITETGRVNITSVLNNSGLVKVINGGTIKYSSQTTGVCTTTPNNQYEVNLATNRYWYLGPATNNAVRSNFGALATSGVSNTGTQMWSWKENLNAPSSQGGYTPPEYNVLGSNSYFKPGLGYVLYNYSTYNSSTPQSITTNGLFNDSIFTISGLTRTAMGSAGSWYGYHLLSNPYPSFLDAEKFFDASSNLVSTLWYRTTAQGSPVSVMTFNTYNVAAGVSVNGSGGNQNPWYSLTVNGQVSNPDSVARFIPPMQGFWVRVANTSGGAATFNPSTMTVVAPENCGTLRSSTSSPLSTLVKLSAQFGQQIDQMAVGLGANAQNNFDNYDSEKMFTSGYVQIYTANSGKKLALNSLKNNKAKTSVPITLECPSNGWYSIHADQIIIDNGTVLLEDKLNNIFYDLSIDSTISFFSNSGVISSRFVLHFMRPSVISNPVGPSSLEDLVSETLHSEIELTGSSTGKVTVSIQNVEDNTKSSIRVIDINGKIVDTFDLVGKNFEFQLNQGQGVYIVEVTNGFSCEKKKIFIQ